jgi:ATP-dependent DNA helicase 2 subunit 2
MADKEVTVYIVDVARSMGKPHNGRDQSDLDWALQWVYEKITGVVFTGRKTLQVGVIALGTDGTDNSMVDDSSYEHITIVQPIAQILMPELQNLPNMLKPSRTDERDVVSAIILGVDMIARHCKTLKFKKKLMVITNALGSHINEDDNEATAEMFKTNGIELTLLGVDFDDPEFGFKEEDKPDLKRKNEAVLKKLVDMCGGQFGTMQEAIDELARPQLKAVRPTPTYRGMLRLGDPTKYDTALTIDVERYMKVSIRRPPTASAFAVRPQGEIQDEKDDLMTVHNLYKYKVKSEEHEGGEKILQREELEKGYEYGRTAVSISESDANVTQYETEAGYDILGFVPADNIERYMAMDNANMIVAQKGSDKAAMALSSLVHALYELGSAAIGRLVKKDMAEPILTVLSPLVESDYECLIENVLPFAEDVRSYRFPPIDKVLTVSGKSLIEHRHLPSKQLVDSMSDFVDNMMLVDENGENELLAVDDTFSPMLHTIEGAIKYRAVHGSKSEIIEKAEAFQLLQHPPQHLQEQSKPALERLKEAADAKKVPPAKKGRYKMRNTEKPLSGLNVADLLKPRVEGAVKIDPKNAVAEFQQLMSSVDNANIISDAVKQMKTICENLATKSYGDKNYARVVEMLSLVRKEMVDVESAALYNDLLRDFKQKIFAEKLGGNRRELWLQIRNARIGLITNEEEAGPSDVSKDQADEFMRFPSRN